MTDGFLSRWARLKRERERAQGDEAREAPRSGPTGDPADASDKDRKARGGSPVEAPRASLEPAAGSSLRQPASAEPQASGPASEAAAPAGDPNLDLPPLESLTPTSDFTPFLRAGVASATRSAALKTLFQDPHFNVMDGLDIYIDDYTKSEPIPESLLRRLVHSKTLGLFDEPEKDASTTPPLPEKDGAGSEPEKKAAAGPEQGEASEAAEVAEADPGQMPEDLRDEPQAAEEPIDPPESAVDAPPVPVDSNTKTT
jgi:hypothetical protein